MDIARIIERYRQRRIERENKLRTFLEGKTRFIVIQKLPSKIFNVCNSLDLIYANNLAYFEQMVDFEWTDDLPYLEPWIGTGVYANAFGCEYLWRNDEAPDIHCKFHSIEEVRGIECPDYQKSPVMRMVLECIEYFKEKTHGALPISLTDTQSPFDTATLILDTSEFFTSCYTERHTVLEFMDVITQLIIQFSQLQIEKIGPDCLVQPGHVMPSIHQGRGIAISDDNLAVSSPKINNTVALPFDKRLGEVFGGVAIHSCGSWAGTMKLLPQLGNVTMVDCRILTDPSPGPNQPADVRDALKGSDIVLKVRVGNDMRTVLPVIEKLFDPSLQLAVELAYSAESAETNYNMVTDKLSRLYAGYAG